MATTLALSVWRTAVPAYAAASLVCAERLNRGAHVPSPILAGAVLGIAVAARVVAWTASRLDAAVARLRQRTSSRRFDLVALCGALLVLAAPMLLNLGRVVFLDPDEGRYAAIAYEVARAGDFVTPRLDHVL